MDFEYQSYSRNTIQTVNRQIMIQAHNRIDNGLTDRENKRKRIYGHHMNRRYNDLQRRHGYHDNSYLNRKLHKDRVMSKLQEHNSVKGHDRMRIDK